MSTPTAVSRIEFEVWLPAAGWNGRYVGAGNGGSGGTINYYRLAEAVNAGYAGSSTDAGHRRGPIEGHEAAVDFDHRAIHETAINAKQVIRAFYSQPPHHSYFHSCSTGGRQALTEAQLYPSDYGTLGGARCCSPCDYRHEISCRRGLDEWRRANEAVVSVSGTCNLDRHWQP